MVIKGTVQNGQIHIDNTSLPDGTRVLITPVPSLNGPEPQTDDILQDFKDSVDRIAELPCEGKIDDDFSGADHDRILYGN